MWIVLGTNSTLSSQVFGPFASEAAAGAWARKMDRKTKTISWVAMPVTEREEAEKSLIHK